MNIRDWQRAKEELKRSPKNASPSKDAESSQSVPARIEVLEAELAAIAARPLQEEGNATDKSNS
jgi:hypothetical protein